MDTILGWHILNVALLKLYIPVYSLNVIHVFHSSTKDSHYRISFVDIFGNMLVNWMLICCLLQPRYPSLILHTPLVVILLSRCNPSYLSVIFLFSLLYIFLDGSTRAIYQTILVMHVQNVCPFVGLHSRIVEIYPWMLNGVVRK